MALLTPRTYRFRPDQDHWLKQQARQHEEGEVSRVLRKLIDRAMRKDAAKQSAA